MKSAPLLRKAGPLEDEYGLHVLPLSVFLLEVIGPTYIGWESPALRAELEERVGPIGTLTWERIQALRVLHAHDGFWKEWEVFEKISAAINGQIPLFNLSQPPEAGDLAITLDVASKIDTHEFDEDVKAYVVASCLEDGLWYFEGQISDVGSSLLQEHDRRMGIDRDVAAVAAELQRSEKFRVDPQSFAEVQANRVLEVREVLKRYNEAVRAQLDAVPEILKGVRSRT